MSSPRIWPSAVDDIQHETSAIIIVNRPLPLDLLEVLWAKAKIKICADGGANRLHDSLGPEDRDRYTDSAITQGCGNGYNPRLTSVSRVTG
jgi:thiamine pyrophosphokinase